MDNITLLVLSCDNFSDLWEGHLKMYNTNWPERNFETYLVTDKQTDKRFPEIGIIAIDDKPEWTDRLKAALAFVKTDYVFITLDDYFLIEKINKERVSQVINYAVQNQYDYIRFFKRPVPATSNPIGDLTGLFNIDKSIEYSVNLYPGLWKKEFLNYTLESSSNAWKYEISLTDYAINYNARCLVNTEDDFVILDVVRKGKLLRSANRYFQKHPHIYSGSRPLQSFSDATKLWVKTMGIRYMPRCFVKHARKLYVRLGGTSFKTII